MRIAITAANGMIGSALTQHFAEQGHELTLVVRRPVESIHTLSLWNPATGEINAADLEAQDVIINLAGRNVADRRWTPAFKQEIVSSRLLATELIVRTLKKLSQPPQLLLNASAIGVYGDRPHEAVDEDSAPGTGFMAESCVKWEAAANEATGAIARVVCLRIGVVITRSGGVVQRLLPIFRLGLGGKLGNGQQVMSWIALAEIPLIIDHIIANTQLSGPFNLTSPNPVTNEAFTAAFGRTLRRPAIFSVPPFALKLGVGEMATDLLLTGASVQPRKLLGTGYTFRYSELDRVLTAELSSD
jgi:uncharacterized protein (TIGR01777 family)